ncbi:hypothetical protein AAFF_G00166010 [Aldrovandia affinis]|uniref:thiopurine S-methyltransferase n=1 Tax=Aldrovandia affinis TaxID=143900 RepID=A0AAD7RM35_9TELE|nr:hypothetical protein AAFF_G00166010 [Aldrovandia affinis]
MSPCYVEVHLILLSSSKLADMGHSVVGVEISEKAIKQFFEEQNLSYSEESVPKIQKAKLFESSDGTISLYQCDVLKFSSTIAGQFGGIWDRASLVAINPCDRQRYSTLIMSLMDKDCRYLLDTLQYNPELYEGPPFCVSDEDVKNLYGKTCDIQLLYSADALPDRQRAWGLDYLIEKVHLLTPKSDDASPSHGRWVWNEENKEIEFLSFGTSADIKEKKKKSKLGISQEPATKRPERLAQSPAVAGKARARSPTDRTAVGEAQLNAYKSSQRDESGCVTIEDVKQATLILLKQKESSPIPLGFLHVLRRQELDEFLSSLLLYLACYFEKAALEKQTTPHMMEQSLREQQEMAEASVKVELSLKQVAIHYSTLLLELTLPMLSAGKGKTSSKDREVFEYLYRFLCYAAWVTFGRKDLANIEEEVGRLLYSTTFNPACKLRAEEERAKKEGEAEAKEPACPPVSKRKCPRRLDLTKVLTQRTPLMEALLPPTAQAAPHLFKGITPTKERSLVFCNRDVVLDQLTDRLKAFRFGILGKPLSQFSGATLIPQGEENKDEEKEGGNLESFPASAGKQSSPSRTNTAISRATTEGGYSDTE